MKNRRIIPLIVYLLLLVAVFSWAGDLFSGESSQLPYSQVVQLFREEQVRAFEIQDDIITMELHTPIDGETIVRAKLAYPETFLEEMSDVLEEQQEAGVLAYYDLSPEEPFSPYQLILPLVLLVIKELFTGITSLLTIRKTGKVEGAVWHGKITTVLLYTMMGIHLIWFHIPPLVSGFLIGISTGMMLLSAVGYAMRNFRMLKGHHSNRSERR